MSKKDAKKFIDLLHTDAGTRKAVHDAAEKIADIAKSKGYKTSRAELSDALKDHWSQNRRKTDKHPTCAVKFSEVPGF